jgi:four helix bundle protein
MAGVYTELRAWKQAVDLVVEVYRSTQNFPRAELYGLTNQIRRCAVSVPSNIAEGKGRSTDREFALFLTHARGSLLELETQLLIANKLGYMNGEPSELLAGRTEQLAKTINALLNTVRGKATGEGRYGAKTTTN